MTDPTWDAIILAAAAVTAAGIAARTANRRMGKQLLAESERLDKQLAHDRWMREAEELRQLVDEAAAAGLAAGNAVHALRNLVRDYFYKPVGSVELPGGGEWRRAERLASDAVDGMQGYVERLELRLGREHDIPSKFAAWQLRHEHALDYFKSDPPSKADLEEGGKQVSAAAQQYLDFMEAARHFVALGPPVDEDPAKRQGA